MKRCEAAFATQTDAEIERIQVMSERMPALPQRAFHVTMG